MADAREVPVFPLGTTLLPGGVLPLHIFEQRYQVMLNDALEGDRTFAVVLISRGSEVGGGEVRTTFGTLARIREHSRFDDGRAAVVADGLHRVEVLDWLPDDPYPKARMVDLHEPETTSDDRERLVSVRGALGELWETAHRIGRLDGIPEIEWATDTADGVWQVAALAPIGELDRQALLTDPDNAARIERLDTLIRGVDDDLRLLGDID